MRCVFRAGVIFCFIQICQLSSEFFQFSPVIFSIAIIDKTIIVGMSVQHPACMFDGAPVLFCSADVTVHQPRLD